MIIYLCVQSSKHTEYTTTLYDDTRRNGKLISPIIHTLCIILRQECVGICQINKDLFVVCYSNNELLCCCQFGFQNASPRPSGYRKILQENEMKSPYETLQSNAKKQKRVCALRDGERSRIGSSVFHFFSATVNQVDASRDSIDDTESGRTLH